MYQTMSISTFSYYSFNATLTVMAKVIVLEAA
jgi:hypothetical protein